MLESCWYCEIPELCDACVARWIEIHRSNAAAIGRSWARAIISRTADRAAAKPWPAFDASERMRTGAMQRISSLVSDVPRVRAALAEACAAAAGEGYEAWRATGAMPPVSV